MNTSGHLLLSLLLLVLYPYFGPLIIVSIVAAILIDIDHVPLIIHQKAYTYQKIKWIIKNIQDIYKKNGHERFKGNLYLFHTVEFNIILLIAAIYQPILWYVLGGFVFHIITDIIAHWPSFRWLFILTSIR